MQCEDCKKEVTRGRILTCTCIKCNSRKHYLCDDCYQEWQNKNDNPSVAKALNKIFWKIPADIDSMTTERFAEYICAELADADIYVIFDDDFFYEATQEQYNDWALNDD